MSFGILIAKIGISLQGVLSKMPFIQQLQWYVMSTSILQASSLPLKPLLDVFSTFTIHAPNAHLYQHEPMSFT